MTNASIVLLIILWVIIGVYGIFLMSIIVFDCLAKTSHRLPDTPQDIPMPEVKPPKGNSRMIAPYEVVEFTDKEGNKIRFKNGPIPCEFFTSEECD